MNKGELTYDMLLQSTLPFEQCREMANSDILFLGIMCLIAILIFGVFLVYFAFQNKNMSSFIKKENLETKYQKYKQMNKGLQ